MTESNIYYSATTNGFYFGSLFGEPHIGVPDPAWQQPTNQITLQPGEHITIVGQDYHNDTDAPLIIEVHDTSAEAPLVEIPNPACTLPADAKRITSARHQELLAGVSEHHRITPDAAGYPQLVYIQLSPADQTAKLLDAIDQAADTARRAVAGDPLRAVEYDRARLQAEQFAAANYQGEVPPMVAAWAINGRTPQQAADSILAEAAAYTHALELLRTTRLAAKEQIRTLMAANNLEAAQQLAAQTVAAIEQAVAGIGNNA